MPKTKRRREILYQRGIYRLEWDRRADGSLRSPFLTIFWYDHAARREKSRSTGQVELEAARARLDAHYIERSEGLSYCPACGQPKLAKAGYQLVDAIEAYLVLVAAHRSSGEAIRARLAHVLDYLATLEEPAVPCEAVDEAWVAGFRRWAQVQPIISPKGKARDRTLSTVENSVIQLAAAINKAYELRNTTGPARFKAVPSKQVNRTPQHRSSVRELARLFRYCVAPAVKPGTSEQERARRIRERRNLHRFLMISIATLARPDAAHDVSTDAKRRQWNSKARILDLNPFGRRQTKKRRPIVPIAWQVAHHLDGCRGFFVPVRSVGGAWDSMAKALGLPGGGEGGMKLIRRSVANELRQPARGVPTDEIEMMLGHRPIDSTSELYAPFDPAYLARARAAIEAIIDEIEAIVPGAFALPTGNVVTLRTGR